MDVASALKDARAQVERSLQRHGGELLTLTDDEGEEVECEIATPNDLDDLQIGYSISPSGESFVSGAPGSWRAEWLVIGYDTLCGDPLFVDLSQPELPVFTAAHGAGSWEPEPISPALDLLLFQT